jgi:hypothetical protein
MSRTRATSRAYTPTHQSNVCSIGRAGHPCPRRVGQSVEQTFDFRRYGACVSRRAMIRSGLSAHTRSFCWPVRSDGVSRAAVCPADGLDPHTAYSLARPRHGALVPVLGLGNGARCSGLTPYPAGHLGGASGPFSCDLSQTSGRPESCPGFGSYVRSQACPVEAAVCPVGGQSFAAGGWCQKLK